MTLRVVVSFEHSGKARATWLARRLQEAGFEAITEDSFGAESPRTEMRRAIEECDAVVAIITYSFPDSKGAERELRWAEALDKPVIALFAGLPSRSPLARDYATYRRVELVDWDGSDENWEEILELLTRALAEQQRRSRRRIFDRTAALTVPTAYLFHDIEDRALAFRLLQARPGWRLYDHDSDADKAFPRVLLWTAASSERHSLAYRSWNMTPPELDVFIVRTTDAPAPPDNSQVLSIDRYIGSKRVTDGASTQAEDAVRESVKRLLDEAYEQNDNAGFDIFTERFCGNYRAAGAAEEACSVATSYLPAGDEVRLRAVYQHSLALRFYGDWRAAVELLADELAVSPENLPKEAEAQRLRVHLELLNVEYELGEHVADRVDQQVRNLQQRFSELTELHGYVQAGRVLGNVLREQGNFGESERVLQRTIGVAEYLTEQVGKDRASELLLADCHRELAGLYIARHDITRAMESLRDARSLLAPAGARIAADRYLSAALDYVDATLVGRDDKLIKATTPTERAQNALERLAGFGNPIRVAAVYDWLGQAWARQVPRRQEDLNKGEEYLRKALRIRESHGHTYTCGLSHLSLGKLYEASDDLSGEIWHYKKSLEIFAERRVQPALARAHAALARAYFRKARSGDADAEGKYQFHLVSAENLYREIHLADEGIELRYELEHGGRHAVDEVSDDTPLVAVGEYLLHRWIREHISHFRPHDDPQFELTLDIGDDAAVLTPTGIEPDNCMVFTTDSAPGSLSALSRSPEYVGKFAVVQTVADIISMGARPVGLLVNIFLSRAATVGYVKRLIDAVAVEASRYGVPVIGGDIKEREEQSVGCVGIGSARRGHILTRSAAAPGQALCITLAANPVGPGTRLIGARWAQELIEHYQMNNPMLVQQFPALANLIDERIKYDLLCVPTTVMASAVATGRMRAGIDTSDGVLACLEIIGRESNVGFELDESAILKIIDPRARQLAGILELSAVAFLFSAGHDWEIVFTCESDDFPVIAAAIERDLNGAGQVARIGTVTGRRDDSAIGVQLKRVNGALDRVLYYTDEKFVPHVYQDRPGQWLEFASHLRPMGDAF